MSATLEINGASAAAAPGTSIFDVAEALDVRIPTSCAKQGRCRECLVEVAAGMDLLAARTPEEAHLTGDFRLSCRAQVVAREGLIRCHTLRRGAIHVEDRGMILPHVRPLVVDAAVKRV